MTAPDKNEESLRKDLRLSNAEIKMFLVEPCLQELQC